MNQTIYKQVENTNFNIPDSTFVILKYNSDWYWLFKDAEPTILTENELVEIENIIEKALKENNEQQQGNIEKHNKEFPNNKWTETGFEIRTKGFKRQYVPVINSKEQKKIWINFFCDDRRNEDWKSELTEVEDGGNCYFHLKVNLETGTYSELNINGYA